MTLENESGREYPSNILAVGGLYNYLFHSINNTTTIVWFCSTPELCS